MKRILLATVIMLSLVFSFVGTAQAVTDGELDGNGHPYVGLMVAQAADGTPLWRCSGTLISPTVFLTAGHCTEAPAAHAEIWFAADVQAGQPGNGYPFTGDVGGTTYLHPQFDPNAFFLFDLGVVVLDTPVTNLGLWCFASIEPARCPENESRYPRRNFYRGRLWAAKVLPGCCKLERSDKESPHGCPSQAEIKSTAE